MSYFLMVIKVEGVQIIYWYRLICAITWASQVLWSGNSECDMNVSILLGAWQNDVNIRVILPGTHHSDRCMHLKS